MKLGYLLPAAILGVAAAASPAGAQYRGHPGPTHYEAATSWHLREQTATAAHVLHERAAHFAEMVGHVSGYAHIADDTYALADASVHFHQVVESGAPREHAIQDFVRVQQAWRHVREEFARAHDVHHIHHLNDDWARLTDAFAQAAHTLREETYGHGSYGHAPHYDEPATRYYYRDRYDARTYRPRARVRVRVPRQQYRYRYELRW